MLLRSSYSCSLCQTTAVLTTYRPYIEESAISLTRATIGPPANFVDLDVRSHAIEIQQAFGHHILTYSTHNHIS